MSLAVASPKINTVFMNVLNIQAENCYCYGNADWQPPFSLWIGKATRKVQ
jgi:hypothetical protein